MDINQSLLCGQLNLAYKVPSQALLIYNILIFRQIDSFARNPGIESRGAQKNVMFQQASNISLKHHNCLHTSELCWPFKKVERSRL